MDVPAALTGAVCHDEGKMEREYLKLTSTPLIVVSAGFAKLCSGKMAMNKAFNKSDFIFKAKKNLRISILLLYLLCND